MEAACPFFCRSFPETLGRPLPLLFGWLTDNYSWRWVFYINVPIGVLALFLTQAFIFDPPYLRKESKGIDYWGIGLLVLGIGSLQIMLDKGQEDDWFSSHFILTLSVLAIIGLGGLIIRELKAEHPIIDLSVFRYRSYAIGTFIMTVVGFVLYGSTVLLPLLMQELLGCTATHAGVTNLPRGMASFLFMPLVGYLTGKVDARKLLAAGFLATAFAMYWISNFSLGVASSNFWLPLTVQGAGLGLIFVPLTTVTNDPIPRKDGQRHQHLQPDAQYRRQRWHRDGGDHAGSQVAIAHQHSGRTRQPGEPAGASNRGWDAGPFHVTRQGRSNRDPAGLWRGVGNGAAAGGYARL